MMMRKDDHRNCFHDREERSDEPRALNKFKGERFYDAINFMSERVPTFFFFYQILNES